MSSVLLECRSFRRDCSGRCPCRVGVPETAPIYMSLHIILAPDIAPFRNVTSDHGDAGNRERDQRAQIRLERVEILTQSVPLGRDLRTDLLDATFRHGSSPC